MSGNTFRDTNMSIAVSLKDIRYGLKAMVKLTVKPTSWTSEDYLL